MKTVKWLVPALAALLGLSCVVSLLPLFEDAYLVSKPGLLGTWKTEDSADTWTFEQADGLEYRLIHRQAEYGPEGGTYEPPSKKVPGDTVRFRARFGRLGAGLFLDLVPADKGNPEIRNDLYNFHLVPGHTLARVWLEGDLLRIAFLDDEWLNKAIEDGRIALAHVKTGDRLILTAPTAEMQSFILKYGDDGKAFSREGGEPLRRVK